MGHFVYKNDSNTKEALVYSAALHDPSSRNFFTYYSTIMQYDDDDTVPTLLADGSNWVVYRKRLVQKLKSSSLQLHLTHAEAPKEYSALETVRGLDGPACWDRDEGTVKTLIADTIPDSTFYRIKECTCAKDVWETVTKIYEEQSKTIAADLYRRLRNKRCREGENVHTHFKQLFELREQLAELGQTVDDDEYIGLLLMTLPSSYDSTLTTINVCAYITESTLTPDIVIKIVGDAYDLKRSIENKEDTANARNKKKDIKCLNCKKRGHVKADCWAKGGEKEGQRPIRRGQDKKSEKEKMRATAAEEDVDILFW